MRATPGLSGASASRSESAFRAPCPSVTFRRGHSPCRCRPVAGSRQRLPPSRTLTILSLARGTGTSARAYCAGSAPTLYSSQVQQQARIPAHYGEPLRTTERTLTWPYAGMHVHVPVSGGQGVAGSNPAVPTGKGYFSLRRSGANSGANRFPGVRLSRLGGLRDRLPFIGAAPL